MQNFSIPVKIFSVDDDQNPDFLRVRLEAISEGLNRHNTYFTLESMEKYKDTFKGKPLLCAYTSAGIGDGHNYDKSYDVEDKAFYRSFVGNSAERCVGYIPENSNITIEKIGNKNWIVMDAVIFKRYNYELAKDILKVKSSKGARNNKKISVEIVSDPNGAEMRDLPSGKKVEFLHTWEGIGCTILGDKKTEAIPGANLMSYSVSDEYSGYRELLAFAYNNMDELEFMSKEDYGTGNAVTINREKISDTAWGDIDKIDLRNKVLRAKNYRELVKFIYLKVEEGWEDAPSQYLKYPVAQISGGEAFYNRNGLSSAQGYAQQHDPDLVPKIKRIIGKFEKEEDKDNNAMEKNTMNGVDMVAEFTDVLQYTMKSVMDYLEKNWETLNDDDKEGICEFMAGRINKTAGMENPANPEGALDATNNAAKGAFVPSDSSYDVRWFAIEPDNKFMTYGIASIEAGGPPKIGNRAQGLPAVLVEPDGKIFDIGAMRTELSEYKANVETMNKTIAEFQSADLLRKFEDIVKQTNFSETDFGDIKTKIELGEYCDENTMRRDVYAKVGELSMNSSSSAATFSVSDAKKNIHAEKGWKGILAKNGIGGK